MITRTVCIALALITAACSGNSGSIPDAFVSEARVGDAAAPDAKTLDAGLLDASIGDAGLPDASSIGDAGLLDASIDECGPQVSFRDQVQPIFTATCAVTGCHGSVNGSADLDLSAGAAYAELVHVPSLQCSGRVDQRSRVEPGLADNSYLIHKLLGVDMCQGSRMPVRSSALPDTELDLIRGWICHGAANN